MTTAVVEVGPQTVRGPDVAPPEWIPEWISVALDCIDDRIALLDGRLVEVRRLWSDLLAAAAGGHRQTLLLVVPTWWASSRVEMVTDAAGAVATDVIVVRRSSVLSVDADATVVELAEEFVVIAAPGAQVRVRPRGQLDLADVLGAATEILVDVPAEVAPPALGAIARLRSDGAVVTSADRQRMTRSVGVWLARRAVLDAALDAKPDSKPDSRGGRRRSRVAAVLAGAVVSAAVAGGAWLVPTLSGQPSADAPTALLVEGRVAVQVPARWAVERITSGPGSARVRVSAPSGGSAALHLTQFTSATPATIDEVAETLRRALESERPGVFVDWNPAATLAGRSAVTYRELRAESETGWAVVIDGATRIAIGCQSPLGHTGAIREACERAVKSAHVLR